VIQLPCRRFLPSVGIFTRNVARKLTYVLKHAGKVESEEVKAWGPAKLAIGSSEDLDKFQE
jgi:hypothetical protein